MSARTRLQIRRTGSGAYSSPPLFHASAKLQAPILQQYKTHPQLFMESRVTDQTMERIYNVVRYWMLRKNLPLDDLVAMLMSIHKKLNFVAYHEGAWWRIARKPACKVYKWRRQTVVFTATSRHLVNDASSATQSDGFRPRIISCAAINKGLKPGLRVLKWPHFGTRDSLSFEFDGTAREKPLCEDDLAEISGRLKAGEVWVPDVTQGNLAAHVGSNDAGDSKARAGPQTSIMDFLSQQQATAPGTPDTQSQKDRDAQSSQDKGEGNSTGEMLDSDTSSGTNTPVDTAGNVSSNPCCI